MQRKKGNKKGMVCLLAESYLYSGAFDLSLPSWFFKHNKDCFYFLWLQHFRGLSFPTISSVGPNAAIMHYSPQSETCAEMDPNSIYLCDSGAQVCQIVIIACCPWNVIYVEVVHWILTFFSFYWYVDGTIEVSRWNNWYNSYFSFWETLSTWESMLYCG